MSHGDGKEYNSSNPLSVDPPQGSYDEQQSTSTSGATEDDEVNDDTCVFITW